MPARPDNPESFCRHPFIAVHSDRPMGACADCGPLLYRCLECGAVGRYDEMKARW